MICSHLLVTKFLDTETLRAANNKPTIRQINLLFGEIILYVHCSSHCYTFTLLQAHDNSFYTAMLSHVGVHTAPVPGASQQCVHGTKLLSYFRVHKKPYTRTVNWTSTFFIIFTQSPPLQSNSCGNHFCKFPLEETFSNTYGGNL